MKAFDKVIGYEAIKTEFYQIIDMAKNPDKYEKLGARMPKGVLLEGKPGLGKTLMCKCFIEDSGLPAYTIRRDAGDEDFINKITKAYENAKANAPAIVFLDDIDKFANEDQEHVDCPEYVAVQSGIDSCKDEVVITLATANRANDLPESLKRTGRFDRYIRVPYPSPEDAAKILKYYMEDKCIDPELNLDDVIKMTGTDACCVLETVMNEAAINAAFSGSGNVKIEHILSAVLRLTYDCPDDTTPCSVEEKERRAAHEAGHLTVALALEDDSVGLVSIKNSGRMSIGGFVHICRPVTRRPIDIAISLGGKAGTELTFPRVASGCIDDIRNAFESIQNGVLGNATLGYALIENERANSETLLSMQDAVTHAELERYSVIARNIILANMEFYNKARAALCEKETLLFSDIKKIEESTGITHFEI